MHRYGNPEAPRMVLLHGVTDAGTNWPDLVERWGDRWDILAPDHRGHGESPRFTPEQRAVAADVLVADTVAILDAEPEPVALVGHSLGAVLALRATLARPEKVWALVLEDPPNPAGNVPAPDFVAGIEKFLDDMHDQAGHIARMQRDSSWSDAEIDAWAICKLQVDRDYIREGLFLGDGPLDALLNDVAVPTLLIVPTESPMTPVDVSNPLVQHVFIDGAGHCVRRDQPDAYFEAVEKFLADATSH